MIPEEFRTSELYDSIFTPVTTTNTIATKHWSKNWLYLPVHLKTKEFAKKILCLDGLEFYGMEWDKIIDQELVDIAMRQNYKAFEYIPSKFATPEMCLDVMEKDGMFLGYIPKNLRNKTIIHKAIEKNGFAIQFLEESEKTYSLCQLAVLQNPASITRCPAKLIPKLLPDIDESRFQFTDSYRKFDLSFFRLHKKKFKIDIIQEYLRQKVLEQPEIVEDTNENFGEDIYCLAIQQNPEILRLIPTEYLTDKMVELALEEFEKQQKYPSEYLLDDYAYPELESKIHKIQAQIIQKMENTGKVFEPEYLPLMNNQEFSNLKTILNHNLADKI